MELPEQLAPEVVVTDAADRPAQQAKPRQVVRNVHRRAAGMPPLRQDVPQHLAEAENVGSSTHLSGGCL